MIRINLLPHREEARKQRRSNFYALALGAVLFGALINGGTARIEVKKGAIVVECKGTSPKPSKKKKRSRKKVDA